MAFAICTLALTVMFFILTVFEGYQESLLINLYGSFIIALIFAPFGTLFALALRGNLKHYLRGREKYGDKSKILLFQLGTVIGLATLGFYIYIEAFFK